MTTDGPSGPNAPLKLGFAGTPDFAARILEALLAAGRVPALVYTQPDRPAGRGRKLSPSAVKVLAEGHGLPLRQPSSLKDRAEVLALEEQALDVLVVAAYGLLLPPPVLAAPRLGCINVHASLLPRWRGAAPIERAIMAGDSETGACIMQMDAGLDTGPVYLCRRCPITDDTDAASLERQLAALGSDALLHCLERLPSLAPEPQPAEGATYAAKLTRADAIIHWQRPALEIERQVRALADRLPPFSQAGETRLTVLAARAEPGAAGSPGTVMAFDRKGLAVACGEGILNIQRLRLNVGKGRPMSAAEAANGYAALLAPGSRLTGPDPAP